MASKVLLGITGGIAAYKCAELVRRFKNQGLEVRVVMTESAKAFITPLTFQALSANPVSDSLLDPSAEAAMGHIELAKWADLILIAPASANCIARLANGLADDLLSTLVLATPAPVAIAPAMNQQMYKHPATQRNLQLLKEYGTHIWGPAAGEQACGDVGPGRMLEPEEIAEKAFSLLQATKQDAIKLTTPSGQPIRLTITAGPTREAIDPVRYISNHSSGKMGFALADAASELGIEVTLIAGPVSLPTPAYVDRIDVNTAQEMYEASMAEAKQTDIFIACAAVADFRPVEVAEHKLKKKDGNNEMDIVLTKNPDIVATVASLAENRPFTVGFAAETQQVEKYAKSKLARKNLDMICANNVADKTIGFNADQNALSIYWQDGSITLPVASKSELAKSLLNLILTKFEEQ